MENSFKNNLREELNYQDITVKELSAKTGIPKPTLDCYLSARQTIPPVDVAVKIAQALNVTVESLVLGKNSGGKLEEELQFKELRSLNSDFLRLPENSRRDLLIMIHALSEAGKK